MEVERKDGIGNGLSSTRKFAEPAAAKEGLTFVRLCTCMIVCASVELILINSINTD